jgi:hypothetical protein
MAKKQQHTDHRDKVLMAMCRKAAKKRGLDPDEPSFKAYCTRLYNQTMQGAGLSDFASDSDANVAAKRLNKIFENVEFPYRAQADGAFVDFYSGQDFVEFDDVERAFRSKFGNEANFEKLTSPFWASDPSTKAFVEKYTGSSSSANPSSPAPISKPEPTAKKKRTEPKTEPAPKITPNWDPNDDRQNHFALTEALEQTLKASGKPIGHHAGLLGGLQWANLRYDDAYILMKRGVTSSGAHVSSISNMTGARLIELFGLPTALGWSSDNKMYARWQLYIADTVYFEIHDYKMFVPSTSGVLPARVEADNQALLDNQSWSIHILYDDTKRKGYPVITEEECDHGSHFFGDSVFQNAVRFPFKGCDNDPRTTPPAPVEPSTTEPKLKTDDPQRDLLYEFEDWVKGSVNIGLYSGTVNRIQWMVLANDEYVLQVKEPLQGQGHNVGYVRHHDGYDLVNKFGIPTFLEWYNEFGNEYGGWVFALFEEGKYMFPPVYVAIYDPTPRSQAKYSRTDNFTSFVNRGAWTVAVLYAQDDPSRPPYITADECRIANTFLTNKFAKDQLVGIPFTCIDEPSRNEPPSEPTAPPKKRGRGRPPGAKNKPKEPPQPKRPRGRPPGAKNKPKGSEEEEPATPPMPPQPQWWAAPPEPLEPEPASKYDLTPNEFIGVFGKDVFNKMDSGDLDTIQKVSDWISELPQQTEKFITPQQLENLLDILLKD